MDKKSITEFGLLIVTMVVVISVIVGFSLCFDTMSGIMDKANPSESYKPGSDFDAFNRYNQYGEIIPGLYETGTSKMIHSWGELIESKTLIVSSDRLRHNTDDDLYSPYPLAGDLVVPSSVKEVESSGFYNASELTGITFLGEISNIGNTAFKYCSSLKSVYISSGRTTVGNEAFHSCDELSTFYVPDGLQGRVGNYAFYSCDNLESILLSEDTSAVGAYAFQYCGGLKNITFLNKETVIEGQNPLRGCSSLEEITLPYLGKHLGTVFGNSSYPGSESINGYYIPTSLRRVTVLNAGTYFDSDSVFNGCKYLTDITILESDEDSIAAEAFYGCTGLVAVSLPKNITSIGANSFKNCSSLTSITIPGTVTLIGNYAFNGCTNLEKTYYKGDVADWLNISFSAPTSNPMYYAGELYLNDVLVTDITVPDDITAIGDYAFYNCSTLTSVTLPANATRIGNSAFYNCTALTSISLPVNASRIENSAFYNCTALTNISLPANISSLGDSAFYNCTALTSIVVPDTVTTLGSNAFTNCSGLTDITIGSGVTNINKGMFYGCSSLESITLPYIASDSLEDPHFGVIFGSESYPGSTKIDPDTNYYYYIPSTLRNVTILSADLKEGKAFYNCKMLTDITIIELVNDKVGNNTFYGCTKLQNIVLPNSTRTIDFSAFYNCKELQSITIPEGVASLNSSLFYNCTSLKTVTILGNITSVASNAFKNCTALTDIYCKGSFSGLSSGWNSSAPDVTIHYLN